MNRFKWMTLKRRQAALIVSFGLRFVLPAAAQETAAQKSSVEVVFVLDTTGSMGGLIEGAKQKIWSIANEIAKGKPAPRIKMGIVAYRDKGDAYVTKVFDLSGNLDKVYADLLALRADGGGDFPEHVLKALEDAVERISWSKDPKTFKVMYLVGDAPPHFDYGDTPSMEALAQRALRKGVIINAIQCGSNGETAAQWQKLARLGEGKYLAIPQDGGVVAMATPFDSKMAALNRELESSMLVYGSGRSEARREMSLALAVGAAASAPAAAERAVFKSKAGFDGALDLAEAVAAKKIDLKTLPERDLPDSLRGLSPGERERRLSEVRARREALREEIQRLSLDRARFIRDGRKAGSADSFDAKLVESLKEQAARKGIAY